MFERIILVLVGPLSVVLGWFLNEWSKNSRSRREDLRLKKAVLCNLLNFWHIIKSSNPGLIIDIVLGKMVQKLPDPIMNERFFSFLRSKFHDFVTSVIEQMNSKEIPIVKEKLEKSIDLLSEMDPFLAYRLSGKQSVPDFVRIFKETFDEFINTFDNSISNEDIKTFAELKSKFEPYIIRELIEVLEADIREVAASIGRRVYRKIDRKLKEQSEFIAKEMNKKLDELFDSIGINPEAPEAFNIGGR